MASALVPLGKIVYVCDDVVQDTVSGKLTVIGAFNTLRPPVGQGYPYHLGRLCVFAQLAGGHGPATVEVKVVDASTGNEVLGSPAHTGNFPGGHVIVTILIRLLDCAFPAPGIYLVQ